MIVGYCDDNSEDDPNFASDSQEYLPGFCSFPTVSCLLAFHIEFLALVYRDWENRFSLKKIISLYSVN